MRLTTLDSDAISRQLYVCGGLCESPKFTPCTKHIAIKYHHFRKHVADGTISIHHIDTKQQIADIFTEPLDESLFNDLREILMVGDVAPVFPRESEFFHTLPIWFGEETQVFTFSSCSFCKLIIKLFT